MDELSDKMISRALGEELRRTREARGWSRTQLVERLPSGIGERTLLSYEHATFRPLNEWARNTLNECPDGIVEVEPVVVRNLALFIGCTHQRLASYLARFLSCETVDARDAREG